MSSSAQQSSSGKASGGQLEERIDLSMETAAKISQATQLISNSTSSTTSTLQDALSLLSAHEKRCRLGNDTPSLIKVCETSLELCHQLHNHEALLSTLQMLSTRRSQKSKAIAALVTKCLPWVVDVEGDGYTPLPLSNDTNDVDNDVARAHRDALVEELRNITNGKMYLEAERARLTRTMAILKESSGDIAGAANVLQEVHVETYGSISKREKLEFILEQMRLTLLKKDYVRAYIVSNKVKRNALEEEGMASLKIKFYTLLTNYYMHEKEAYELAKCYYAIYSTPSIQSPLPSTPSSMGETTIGGAEGVTTTTTTTTEGTLTTTMEGGESLWKEALRNTVVFLCLAEYSNEVKDMMERIHLDVKLEKLPECKEMLKAYLKEEIIHYPTPYQRELEMIPAILYSGDDDDDDDTTTTPSSSSSSSNSTSSLKNHWHETFHTRIIQHNLRIISLYYRQIHISRLAQLLSLDIPTTEKHVSQMVSNGTLYAKMDRPSDIVRFVKKRSEEEILSDWAGDIKGLLNLVEETTYLIQKEKMVQSH